MSSTYSAAFFLLVLSLLSNASQGIRLQQDEMQPVEQQKIQQKKILADENPLTEESFKVCKDGHCNLGKNRKLLTATASSKSTAITTRKDGGDRKANAISKQKDYKNSQPVVSENLEAAALEHYPDLVLVDISEMDYSPARRKPPIHN